jgi:hypothetical protein
MKRTRLPILPSFAMTAHKSQGQTLKKVIIDLKNCRIRGTESPYVMVSHVTLLDSLPIPHPFRSSKIKCQQSEDVQNEFTCPHWMDLPTSLAIHHLPYGPDVTAVDCLEPLMHMPVGC